ncbi:hypothetical protein TSUD_396030 [Trifolium subterraneum]|uniref:Reverse transcriptase domain-containing protein n=1 Tax=Trifolium subterraneum TaxID=3900 RepID=A0A2Z6N8H8_TRISU|nr:hypothetical protein TSUD_396030 [Trifolium subterraneum]
MLPSHQEVKAVVFALNRDSAPGPDGFGALFFHHFWDIVSSDVINAVFEFFTSSWILPGFNSNIIALLPKTPDATSIDQYRPIAMANFKFKIISKILADRLASIMPSLISEEEMGFIHGRDIKDCLCIASEAANLLHNKSYGGNLALKIDISKAFDTLEWSFLLKVLKRFGFNEIFCNWINVILQSAFLSVSINGKAHGYFNCSRGVRQGDPLSPLLFCLAEDVLSRSISKLVAEGKLDLIKGTRSFSVPSHSFYADDLMILCKGKLSGLTYLKYLFDKYALESGQIINISKSTIFSGSITPGKPKVIHLQPIADKIRMKLSAWKASLLSMAGRVQSVRPFSQGGLNIRSLSNLNKATNLKLCWSLLNSQSSWAKLLRDRVIRKNKTIQYHISSSIWSSIKDEFAVIKDNSIWLLEHVRHLLTSTVSDYINNGHWTFPPEMFHHFNVINLVQQVTIPLVACQDKLLWKHTDTGDLQLKEAYFFKLQQFQDLHWAKSIWSSDIPPSKSILAWRLMHDKVPTDENLKLRVKIWSWFANSLDLVLQFTSMDDMWKICDLSWSPQCKIVVIAALINLLNTIWFARNQARFNNKIITWQSAISMITASTVMTGNNTSKTSSNSIRDFIILKHFKVNIHHPRAPVIKEVIWHPLVPNWIKCNIDGASKGNPGISSCGGIFRNNVAGFMLCFAEPLGFTTSYQAELCGVIRAIEIAHQMNWRNLWLETDSALVVLAVNNPSSHVTWYGVGAYRGSTIRVPVPGTGTGTLSKTEYPYIIAKN